MFAIFTSPYDICQDGMSGRSDILCRAGPDEHAICLDVVNAKTINISQS